MKRNVREVLCNSKMEYKQTAVAKVEGKFNVTGTKRCTNLKKSKKLQVNSLKTDTVTVTLARLQCLPT